LAEIDGFPGSDVIVFSSTVRLSSLGEKDLL